MNAVFTGANFYGQQRALFPLRDQIIMYMNGLVSRRTHDKLRIAGKTPDPFATATVPAHVAKKLAAINMTPQLYCRYMDALQTQDMTIKKLAYSMKLRRKDVADQVARLVDAKCIRIAGTIDGEFLWQWVE